ncbi:dihydrofolate reductase [Capsaspora owczarzaki ATCC 30864]|uniref:Dihydrofolate reductase n=1 Tax=Capsaspora owczarzaki (strain ATCC 30864) TaxID=595528 RepID=A0A0D2WQX3_CAPO3|nr:dihydrofolate reductase [Capsaspora owczarzaki ATCC 30864]KJE94170.1 dihydrofolate reductase [Capsaspora owczarzaki ATCC 30864]|eukprot:XP_004347604.1 dihydrofolate reductase [Capsaspora owczarzaki ATCC 30864]
MTGAPLRILCLHGYTQNATVFRERTGSLRKALKGVAELFYLDAPHKLRPADEDRFPVEDDGQSLAWWIPDLPHRTTFRGFDESIAYVQAHCQREGPFDGILGFSQGAAMTAVLCSQASAAAGAEQAAQGAATPRFRFAMMFAGFPVKDPTYQHFYEKQIHIPSLHVYGESDGIIAPHNSKRLADLFDNSVVHVHVGGHFLPSQASMRGVYLDFIAKVTGVVPPVPPAPVTGRPPSGKRAAAQSSSNGSTASSSEASPSASVGDLPTASSTTPKL